MDNIKLSKSSIFSNCLFTALGLTKSKIRFVKKFINIKSYIKQAVKKFRSEVLRKKYPSKKYWY